jgi:hypothetical protein
VLKLASAFKCVSELQAGMPALPGHFCSSIQQQLRGVLIPASPNPVFPQPLSPPPFSLPPRPSHIKPGLSFFPYTRTSIFCFTIYPKRCILLRHQFYIISFFREVSHTVALSGGVSVARQSIIPVIGSSSLLQPDGLRRKRRCHECQSSLS